MSRSPIDTAVSLVVRLVSEPYLTWLCLVVVSGMVAVLAYFTRHNFLGGRYAKLLSAESERGVTAIE
jgi:hypothetical protein